MFRRTRCWTSSPRTPTGSPPTSSAEPMTRSRMQTYSPPPPPPPPWRPRPCRGGDRPEPVAPVKRDPLWAKLAVILGAVVMLVSGAVVVVPKLAAHWATSGIDQVDAIPTELLGKNIDGAI